MNEISIIIPVLNEVKNIPVFLDELQKVLHNESNFSYEIIFVNDGSTDGTEKLLTQYSTQYSHIKVINFSRNFGKEIALSAGMHKSKGDVAITMDVDLLHPPHLIPEFIKRWQGGDDIVVAIRKSHQGESWWKRLGAYVFYSIMSKMGDIDITPYSTDFRLVSRQVLNAFVLFEERNRMTRGLIDWLGFKRSYIYFDSRVREGDAKYSFTKLVQLAKNAFIKNSLFPLRFIGYLGLIFTSVSSVVGIILILNKYFLKTGWGLNFSAVDMVSVGLVFMMGILLSGMGILALYIADIQIEIRKRPLYIIKSEINI